MKLKRKMPVATAHGPGPRVSSVRSPIWTKIENEYGEKLSKDVREKIVAATRDYVFWAMMELNARPAAEYEALAKSLIKRADDFHSVLQQLLKGGDTERWLIRQIGANLDRQGAPERKILQVLSECTAGCSKAVKSALVTIERSDAFKRGEAWRNWVRAITEVLVSQKLPSDVRKDGLAVSPLVALMDILQRRLPKAYRRHDQSRVALAGGIALAQRPLKRRVLRDG